MDDLTQKPLSDLSLGERKKLLLVRSLLREAPFLLLDEPLNHLDAAGRAAPGPVSGGPDRHSACLPIRSRTCLVFSFALFPGCQRFEKVILSLYRPKGTSWVGTFFVFFSLLRQRP